MGKMGEQLCDKCMVHANADANANANAERSETTCLPPPYGGGDIIMNHVFKQFKVQGHQRSKVMVQFWRSGMISYRTSTEMMWLLCCGYCTCTVSKLYWQWQL